MTLEIDLSGRKALVTGVSSGLGAGIAQALARAGCAVGGCGLEDPAAGGAQAFLAAVQAAGRTGFYAQADLRTAAAPAEWLRTAAEALGGVDILVSNAGRNVFEGAVNCSEAAWQACLDLNLAAHWRLARAALPYLLAASAPVIIVITSNHAYATLPGCFPYNVAKAGLTALVQSLAIEWGPHVRAAGIAPGFIETPGNEAWFNSFANPAAERRRTEQLHPVGRLGTPAEIGALCAFLASPMAGFISGVTLLVDGGRSALLQDPG